MLTPSKLFPLLAFACFTNLGCGFLLPRAEEQPDFSRYFTIRTPQKTLQARLDGDRLYGNHWEVRRYGDSFRGLTDHGTIDLQSDGRHVVGQMRAFPTNLEVSDVGGELRARGVMSGAVMRVNLSPTVFEGTIAGCRYSMRKRSPNDPWYEGTNSCANVNSTPPRVGMPSELHSLPADERAVMLAAFFLE